MVAKVARSHFQPAGALRAISGWLIVLTGLAVLAAEAVRGLDGFALAVGGAMSPSSPVSWR